MSGRLTDYVGSVCEVRTMENDLLLAGRLRAVLLDDNGEQAIELVSLDGGEMPNAAYGMIVKISIFSGKAGFLSLGGRIYITYATFWRINDIKTYGENERRDYFRIKTRTVAKVTGPLRDGMENAPTYKCNVTSISLSGTLIAVKDENCLFHEGEEVCISGLKVEEDRNSDIFNVRATVRRIAQQSTGERLYGCKFIDMPEKDTDRLCQAIFAKQRIDIQNRRGRL
ncbi:MAG: PilZ domain-containing protein [Oscillospiraceae bacterium]